MNSSFAPRTLATAVFRFVFFFISISFSEIVVLASSLGIASAFPIYMFLFSAAFAALLSLICSVCGRLAANIMTFVTNCAVLLLCATQLVYHHIFGSFLSISQVGMGADALTSFGTEAALGISECAVSLLLLLIPTALLTVFTALGIPHGKRIKLRGAATFACAFLILHFGTVFALPLAGAESYSPADIYDDTFVLGMSVRNFGVLTSLRLEVRDMLFGSKTKIVSEVPVETIADTTADTPVLEKPKVYDANITDIDFDSLIENETDESILALHEYFAAKTPTMQNEYTGMFKDYNLIVLCCESFSPYLIDEERTPTLYKMANEGFVFSDYYNTICDNTSNGEYALNTGLLPDLSLLGRGWSTFYNYNSFTVAKNNLLPFCFGNQFRKLDAVTYAVHNYFGNYYGRDKTHPNMGYEFKAIYSGLKETDDWPTSDVSMMEQTLPLFLTPDENGEIQRFHTYFLTFSGHMYYNFTSNNMAIKNADVSENLDYTTPIKAYISCQEELEYALEYLNEQLEIAGVADKTLIVLTADHYPYNLGLEKLSELAGRELDKEFDKFRSSLLIWSASMKEPVAVDVPCCTLDILPTVSNLLGIEFDSRLIMGTDVFSDSEHIAILGDRSFVTDKVYYNCPTGEATLRCDELPDEYLNAKITAIKNKFTVSTEMLYKDYYSYIYGEQ